MIHDEVLSRDEMDKIIGLSAKFAVEEWRRLHPGQAISISGLGELGFFTAIFTTAMSAAQSVIQRRKQKKAEKKEKKKIASAEASMAAEEGAYALRPAIPSTGIPSWVIPAALGVAVLVFAVKK